MSPRTLRVVSAPDADEEEAIHGSTRPRRLEAVSGETADSPEPVPLSDHGPAQAADGADAPAPASAPARLSWRVPTDEDVDRLWDWIRLDGPAQLQQFGVRTSVDLHAKMRSLTQLDAQGSAVSRALVWDGEHVGQGTVFPIVEAVGLVHLYLDPGVRGRGFAIAKAGVQMLKQEQPALRLSVTTTRKAIADFATRMGFATLHYVVTE